MPGIILYMMFLTSRRIPERKSSGSTRFGYHCIYESYAPA